MIGVLGGLSLIVGLFSLIDTSTSTSFSVTYLVIGIVLLIIYFAKEIIPETNFGRKKLMKLSFQTNTIYSNTSWKCRQQERANKISTSSATNIHYKQT